MQSIISGFGSHKQIENVLRERDCEKFMLVCDGAFGFLGVQSYFDGIAVPHVRFDGFSSNPRYDDVCRGVDLFRAERCDSIVAVGGGSAIDVAKCIKLFAGLDPSRNYLEQPAVANADIFLVAVPTTAGTGSESTRFAVIYYDGKKQSVTSDDIIPDRAVLDPSLLSTLPVYQKKCTMLDALCQGIESWWSVNSTEESKAHARKAVETILRYYRAYIFDSDAGAAEKIMNAANEAGRAINISQTTAPHAMSYKLTSLYGIPHGHAVAVCLPKVWRFMTENADKCVDGRGELYLRGVFGEISAALGERDCLSAIERFEEILRELDIRPPQRSTADLDVLVSSVNPTRLGNNPVKLGENELRKIYRVVLEI